jgi:hypothetical protein
MIDAGPSLTAAEGLSAAELLTYLLARGWAARPSRVDGVSILSKTIQGAKEPAEFILPINSNLDEEQRRIADALRTIAGVERRSVESVADDIRRAAPEPKPVGMTIDEFYQKVQELGLRRTGPSDETKPMVWIADDGRFQLVVNHEIVSAYEVVGTDLARLRQP